MQAGSSSLTAVRQPVTRTPVGQGVSSAELHRLVSQARVSMLLQRRAPQAFSPSLSAAAVSAEYTAGLLQLAGAEAAAANPSTAAAAAAVGAEFTNWLAARGAARSVTLQTCTPVDVAMFFYTDWLQRHGASVLSDGQVHAAPSYLSSAISHLSGLFRRLGRSAPYDHTLQVCYNALALHAVPNPPLIAPLCRLATPAWMI